MQGQERKELGHPQTQGVLRKPRRRECHRTQPNEACLAPGKTVIDWTEGERGGGVWGFRKPHSSTHRGEAGRIEREEDAEHQAHGRQERAHRGGVLHLGQLRGACACACEYTVCEYMHIEHMCVCECKGASGCVSLHMLAHRGFGSPMPHAMPRRTCAERRCCTSSSVGANRSCDLASSPTIASDPYWLRYLRACVCVCV